MPAPRTGRTGQADLPLHRGQAPPWLFERMVLLAREMAFAIVTEEGPGGLLQCLSDPVWFQALGCVLGFDWHSSGLTTTVSGALKEGLRPLAGETGVVVAGGKGQASRRTPQEIEAACERSGSDPAPLVGPAAWRPRSTPQRYRTASRSTTTRSCSPPTARGRWSSRA